MIKHVTFSYGIFIKTLDAHYGRISGMIGSCSELKNLVLSGSMDKTIKIWNIQNILEEDFPIDHLDKQIEMLHVSIQAQIAMAQSRNQLVVISLENGRIKYQLCNSPHGAIFTCSALTISGIKFRFSIPIFMIFSMRSHILYNN